MNIYNFKIADRDEYVAANSIFEAIKHYNTITDLEISDFENTDDIILIPEAEWDDYYITDEYGNLQETFAKYMQTVSTVELFVSDAV